MSEILNRLMTEEFQRQLLKTIHLNTFFCRKWVRDKESTPCATAKSNTEKLSYLRARDEQLEFVIQGLTSAIKLTKENPVDRTYAYVKVVPSFFARLIFPIYVNLCSTQTLLIYFQLRQLF